ncbi:MAG: hypothetical protein V2B20_08625 [Pseudomonadota bacterium]
MQSDGPLLIMKVAERFNNDKNNDKNRFSRQSLKLLVTRAFTTASHASPRHQAEGGNAQESRAGPGHFHRTNRKPKRSARGPLNSPRRDAIWQVAIIEVIAERGTPKLRLKAGAKG